MDRKQVELFIAIDSEGDWHANSNAEDVTTYVGGAKDEKRTIRDLVEEIECDRLLKKWSNLSSCIRLFVLDGVMSGRAS